MSYSLDITDENCYSGTTVLINKLGIKDEKQLMNIEGFITGTVAAQLICKPLKADFSFSDYKNIHYQLFSELYNWAGKTRVISLSKSATNFTAPEKIDDLGERIFERLNKLNYLLDLSRAEFVVEVADLYNTINMLHPFREGNGRTQRVFFIQLIRNAGYDIDFSELNSDNLLIGSIQAAAGVMDNLILFFEENIK